MKKSLLNLLLPSVLLAVAANCASAQTQPSGISGLQLWLDAADVNNTGTNAANNASITTWKDKSGQNHNATVFSGQNAGQLQYNQINGKPVVHFTRVSQMQGTVYDVTGVDIRATTMPKVTIFTVYKQGQQSGDQAVWGNDNGNWDRFFFSSWSSFTGADNGGVSRGTNAVIVNNAGLVGTTRLLTAVYDNNTVNGSTVYFNGQAVQTVQDITDPTAAQTTFRIGFDGDDNCFNGDIAEVLVYNRKLTACEIQQVNRYFGSKYGVSFSTVSVNTSGPTTFAVGQSVTLSSSVTGTAYQWLKDGATISNATSSSYTATTSGNYRVAVTNSCVDTSAPVAVSAIVGLPVQLVSFTAERSGGHVALNWQTAEEKGIESFEIERSTTGNSFAGTGIVVAKGNNNLYRFIDDAPLAGAGYYRLRINEHGGSYHYSNTLHLPYAGNNNPVVIYPNPATDVLYIQTGNEETYRVELYDAMGRKVLEQAVSRENNAISVRQLLPGCYRVKITGAQQVSISAILKH